MPDKQSPNPGHPHPGQHPTGPNAPIGNPGRGPTDGPANGLACYDQARINAVLGLDFNAKIRLAWWLARKCALPYLPIMFALYALVPLLQGALYYSKLPSYLQLLAILPIIILLLGLVGLYRCALRYMDGLETGFNRATFLEPLSRLESVLPLVVLVSLFYIPSYVYPLMFSNPFIYFVLLVPCVILPLLFEYNFLYAAEAGRVGGMRVLTVPFRLLGANPKIWLSAVAGYGLGMLAIVIVTYPLGLVTGLAEALLAPETFFNDAELMSYLNIYEQLGTISSPLLWALNLVSALISGLLASAVTVYSVFLFAIAYRQSIFAYNISRSGGNDPCRSNT